jgi:hypothetical protein
MGWAAIVALIAHCSSGTAMLYTSLRAAKASLLVCALLAAACANASSETAADNEARLVGAWQKDLSPQLLQLSPDRRLAAARAGLLGAVMVYGADHRFEMYPPCGAKRDALAAMGVQSVIGTWTLSDAGELAVRVDLMGKPMDMHMRLQWQDEQVVMRDLNSSASEKLGRYDGPLPPAC